MALEQPLHVLSQFEKLHAFVHVGLLGGLMPRDLAKAAVLLLTPLAGEAVVEVAADLPVELVDVHRVDPLAEAPVLGAQPLDGRLMLTPLVGMACQQRVTNPGQHLVIEVQAAEQGGEPLLQLLLAHRLGAGRRPALGFVGVAGAVVVDVALLLDLADHRAATCAARDQAGEGEVVPGPAMLLGEPPVQHALNPLPEIDRHQRLVPPLDQLAVPLVPAGVEASVEDRVDGADRHLRPALAVDEAGVPRHARNLLHRVAAGGVPLEQLGDDWRHLGIDGDDLLAVRAGDIAIAERALGRPDALLGLLLHAFAGFLGQVVDVVLRHQHLDAVHELFRGARFPRQHHAFLWEMYLDPEIVHRHPVLEVAVEPIGFLDQHHANRRMGPQVGDHLAEGGTARLLGGLDVHIFLRHSEAVRRRILLQQLQLRWDRIAFLFLLLRGDAGIDHRLLVGELGGGPRLECFSHRV